MGKNQHLTHILSIISPKIVRLDSLSTFPPYIPHVAPQISDGTELYLSSISDFGNLNGTAAPGVSGTG